jgi:DNA processing protein
MQNIDTHYWLAAHKIPDLNICRLRRILQKIECVKLLFQLNRTELTQLQLSSKSIDAILTFSWKSVEQEIKWLAQPDHHIIPWNSPLYPAQLKEIAYPPMMLFCLGSTDCLKNIQIAVVGSRQPTVTGIEIAAELSGQLVSAGLTITSGLAIGIDTASHQGALHQGGSTIAVLGSGLKHWYPSANIPLAKKILYQGGLLISELPLTAPPLPQFFPKRNRIISGLSVGVIIVEATCRSGSLITAKTALEANREVFAIPGSIRNPLSAGCHQLIQQGAKLVITVNDVLNEIQIPPLPLQKRTQSKKPRKKLDPNHRKLLQCIGYEPTSITELLEKTQLTVNKLTAMLITLEVEGYLQPTLEGYLRV